MPLRAVPATSPIRLSDLHVHPQRIESPRRESRIGFSFSDYERDATGFTASEFDELVEQGLVRICRD
jgi:hypothetical protein